MDLTLLKVKTYNYLGWLRRLEPPASAFTERRSNQLSYSHHGAYFTVLLDLCQPENKKSRFNTGFLPSYLDGIRTCEVKVI